MTNFKKQAFAAITVLAVLANATGSAYAATTTIEVTGNGRDSSNTANVTSNNSSTAVQNNVAEVSNSVKVNADTGGNKANDNSGEVMVGSGNAKTDVTVVNDLNKNVMRGDCCVNGNTDVKIGENHRDSVNTVNLEQNSSKDMYQTNVAGISNNVDVTARTGDNRANDNSGDVDVESGNANTTVTLLNEGNVNWAVLGGTGAGNTNGNVSALVVGNGRDSVNELGLSLTRNSDLLQTNSASVMNGVTVDADTGGNRANDNSGEVDMTNLGNAKSVVGVYNSLNFNMAALDCGCLLGNVHAKIGENDRDSDNTIMATLDDSKEVFQTNAAALENDAEVDATTGDNQVNDTMSGSEDPAIESGNADSTFEVANSGNENRYGTPIVMPGGSQVQLTWNWASMMAFFGM